MPYRCGTILILVMVKFIPNTHTSWAHLQAAPPQLPTGFLYLQASHALIFLKQQKYVVLLTEIFDAF